MKIVYKILIALIVIAVGFGLSLATYHLFGYDNELLAVHLTSK